MQKLETQKLKTRLVAAVLAVLLLNACEKSDSAKTVESILPPVEEQPPQQACSLEGTWQRCQTDGISSQIVELVINNNQLSEAIKMYNNVADCSGTDDGQLAFTASMLIGEVGKSSTLSGGTDVDLVNPSLDLFGCGTGATAYTILKLNEQCNEFVTATTQPACDPSQRGTAFDTSVFLRQ